MVYNLPFIICPVCILGCRWLRAIECNQVALYYFSYTTTTIYKVKEEWCMIVCDTYKDSDKAFLDSGYSGRFVPYKRRIYEEANSNSA